MGQILQMIWWYHHIYSYGKCFSCYCDGNKSGHKQISPREVSVEFLGIWRRRGNSINHDWKIFGIRHSQSNGCVLFDYSQTYRDFSASRVIVVTEEERTGATVCRYFICAGEIIIEIASLIFQILVRRQYHLIIIMDNIIWHCPRTRISPADN